MKSDMSYNLENLLVDLLEYYRIQYVKCAVFMEHAREVIGKIDQLGIRDYFDVIVVSEEAGMKEGAAKIGMKTIWFKFNQPWNEGVTSKPLYCINKLRDLSGLL